ncbi:MAG: PhoU domain-containing protein [Nanoarchaeota archaeon]|nr:PhoU domain-containing protein [Nanoarchaeota archaeon]
MKVRNVQKTGNMFYVYLPSKWSRDKNISLGSRVEMSLDSSGNLILSAIQKKESGKDIKLDLKEDDMYILSKLIMSCFLNPVKSFEIDFIKTLNQKELLHQKKLMSTTFIEVDKHKIYSEPILSISNTLPLFIIMLKKIKNLTRIMIDSHDPELIDRYEEEIDRSNVMINKAVIASFMHKRESKQKLIELHYISLLSNYLERMTDHLVKIEKIDKNEKKFLKNIYPILEELSEIIRMIQEKDTSFNHETVVSFIKKVKDLKVDEKVFREMLIKTSFRHCSEILMDWAITNLIQN